jgi:hypothetical protein
MPSFISKDGIQTPATERVVLYDRDGNPHIYEGPDRAAVEYMKEAGLNPETDHLGMHFTEDSQIIERAHDKNMTIEQFTKQAIYTKEKREKAFQEAKKTVVNHKLPERKDYKAEKNTGLTSMNGGFGEGANALDDAIVSAGKKK